MMASTPAATTIDEYIAEFPPEVRARLAKVRATIRKAAPDATEKISYRMPTYYQNGNLVYFAAFANHIGFFATPSGVTEFEERLAPYHTGKGSVQFPHDQPLPLALIADMVRFRVERNANRPARTSTKRSTRPSSKQSTESPVSTARRRPKS